ncbi:YigZ family protein [Acidaminococcus provencensis]|uniref:YigZ family protein n=1 Tax=Acidaminococcus provencensis TaxID=2058289 RepID=UPI0022E7BFB5|nr:YigZ family protein [Acidaminococcus provencensis]
MGKYIIQKPVTSELVVEKSRFFCHLQRVETEEEAQAFVKQMKKQYWDASHNCSAYIVGQDGRVERSSDDGEPSGTAGSPMLEVLRRRELYDVAAVVTRYFGGIKLGAGGLTRTYGKAVVQAVDEAGLAQRIPMGDYVFDWSMEDAGRVLNQLYRQTLFAVGQVEYDSSVHIHVTLPEDQKLEAEAWLTENLSREVELIQAGSFFAEQPVDLDQKPAE